MNMARKVDIKSLFYITHVENVASMLKNGILSHGLVEARKVPFTPIYDAGIVSNRKEKRPRIERACGNTPTCTSNLATR
jgi:hypothetical protein